MSASGLNTERLYQKLFHDYASTHSHSKFFSKPAHGITHSDWFIRIEVYVSYLLNHTYG